MKTRLTAIAVFATAACMLSTGPSSAKTGVPVAVPEDYVAFASWNMGGDMANVSVGPAEPCSLASPCDPTKSRRRIVWTDLRVNNTTCNSTDWTDGWQANPALWTATLKFTSACGDVSVSWTARPNSVVSSSGGCDTAVDPTPHLCRDAYVTGTVGPRSFTPPPSLGMPNTEGALEEIWGATP